MFSLNSGTWLNKRFETNSRGWRTNPYQSGCVLLPIREDRPHDIRILAIGGSSQGTGTFCGEQQALIPATETTEIFRYDPKDPLASPGWEKGPPMFNRRFLSDAVLLPDQTVLVANGAGRGCSDHSYDPVYETELFDPERNTWKKMAHINHLRQYHSEALLLPDGRVLSAGNTRHFNPAGLCPFPSPGHLGHNDYTIDIFTPPYLLRGSRPQIVDVPTEARYGIPFTIRTQDAADSIGSVVLMRPGSVTHSFNQDQRLISLIFESRGNDTLEVRGPRDATFAPPGHYMLFIVKGKSLDERIPSEAKFIYVH